MHERLVLSLWDQICDTGWDLDTVILTRDHSDVVTSHIYTHKFQTSLTSPTPSFKKPLKIGFKTLPVSQKYVNM